MLKPQLACLLCRQEKSTTLRHVSYQMCQRALSRSWPDRFCLPRHHSVDWRRLENAVYVLCGFPGLSDYFVMPPIKACALDMCELQG